MRAEKAWQLRAMPRPRISATSSSALRSCWWLPHWLTTVVYLPGACTVSVEGLPWTGSRSTCGWVSGSQREVAIVR